MKTVRILGLALGLILAGAAGTPAETLPRRPLPPWAAALVAQCRRLSLPRMASSPAAAVGTAGIRGAAWSPDDLYWKGAGPSPAAAVAAGVAQESEGKDEEALRSYRLALTLGARGELADRAALGYAVGALRRGETAVAARRLRGVLERAADPDLEYAAALPLAVALAAGGEADEARSILEELVARRPDHPLAGQAAAAAGTIRDHDAGSDAGP